MRGWLRGFYDGEGWVTFWRGLNKKRGWATVTKEVGVGNTDLSLMVRCEEYLRAFSIRANRMLTVSKSKEGFRDFHRLLISNNENIARFSAEIGFGSQEKTKKLEAILAFISSPDKYRHGRGGRRKKAT